MNDTFMVEVGDEQYLLTVTDGKLAVEKGRSSCARGASRSARRRGRVLAEPPAPGWHDLFALLRRGDVKFEGDQRVLMAYLLYVKLVLAAPRKA